MYEHGLHVTEETTAMDANRQTFACVLPNQLVQLNIGLMGGMRFKPTLIPQQRIVIMGAMLRELLKPGYYAEVSAEVGKEPTLVVQGEWKADADLSLLLWDSCVLAEQDCIAIYYPSQDIGVLFGPAADKWGAFDKSFFIKPELTQ